MWGDDGDGGIFALCDDGSRPEKAAGDDKRAIGYFVALPHHADEMVDAHDPEDEPLPLGRLLKMPQYKRAVKEWGKFAAWCASDHKVKLAAADLMLVSVEVA